MRDELLLEPKYIREYTACLLEALKRNNYSVNENIFHHNTSFSKLPIIVENGILSIMDQQKKGLANYSKGDLERLSDITSHINGIDGISLSKTGLTDLYRDEDVYNPYKSSSVDIVIGEVKAFRRSGNYGNEFIYTRSILPDMFLSMDIRLMKLIENTKSIDDLEKIKRIVVAVNSLKETAMAIEKQNIYLPIREMSYENDSSNGPQLDILKMAEMPKIKIK